MRLREANKHHRALSTIEHRGTRRRTLCRTWRHAQTTKGPRLFVGDAAKATSQRRADVTVACGFSRCRRAGGGDWTFQIRYTLWYNLEANGVFVDRSTNPSRQDERNDDSMAPPGASRTE
ncbi:hypothetical protein MTO96_052334 [Rhipicephalus appendiculatus]